MLKSKLDTAKAKEAGEDAWKTVVECVSVGIAYQEEEPRAVIEADEDQHQRHLERR